MSDDRQAFASADCGERARLAACVLGGAAVVGGSATPCQSAVWSCSHHAHCPSILNAEGDHAGESVKGVRVPLLFTLITLRVRRRMVYGFMLKVLLLLVTLQRRLLLVTAVSFSPPPQQAPPRSSNVPRKRKERVAELGDDDDDDFVGFPPRPSASSYKATRVAVRKTKKSKSSHSGPKHSEGVQYPSKRTNPNYRSAPNKVVEAIKSLNDPRKVGIRDYPFGSLLDLKLRGLENTKLLAFLMDRLDPDTLTLDIGNGKPLRLLDILSNVSLVCQIGVNRIMAYHASLEFS